jgi:threonine dehydratase
MFTLEDLYASAALVNQDFGATPQYAWPLLQQRVGTEVWVKHENHTPTGAFKVRGGLTYVSRLLQRAPETKGIISATRGNHGQSLARAGKALGLPVTIVVPEGNSTEKNAAMRAFGAELIEHGADYDEARLHVDRLAETRGLHVVPGFHADLVCGVATYALELFDAIKNIDTVYVPAGGGTGLCGLICARNLLGLTAKIVGVVSDQADCIAKSFETGQMIETASAKTFADGMAVRVPYKAAMDVIWQGTERFIRVSDDEIADAIRVYYTDTHNLAEGAGAAPLAALLQEKDRMAGKRVAVILCGGNIDRRWFAEILAGRTPRV